MEVATGQLLHIRLFLEGQEIPVISATVTAQIGSPATAQIEIVPTDRALELLPRTVVHLFYLDYERITYENPAVGLGSAVAYNQKNFIGGAKMEALDGSGFSWGPKDEYYNLFFCGEVFSISYTKSGFGQRSAVLQCLDFSNMWDTSYLYSMRYQNIDPGDGQGSAILKNQVNFLGTTTQAFDDIINYPALTISELAGRRRVAHNPALGDTQDIVGSLFAILELLGGVQGKHFGVNAWATIQERRIRLMDQLGGDSGETATKLYEQAVFEDWIRDRIGGQGAVISFRDLIGLINSYIYYDVAPNPVGVYQEGEKTVPNWPAIDKDHQRLSLVGRVPGATGGGWTQLETGAYGMHGRENLNPWFLDRVNRVGAQMVAMGWNGSPGRPSPLESSLIRPTTSGSVGRHSLGHAADFVMRHTRLGYSSVKLSLNCYDDLKWIMSTEKEKGNVSPYALTHYHIKHRGKDSPLELIRENDKDNIELYSRFFRDLGAVAKSQGLQTGTSKSWAKQTTDENGIVCQEATCYGRTFKEYVWAGYGLGWDPVHTSSWFPLKQILADLAKTPPVLTGTSPEEAVGGEKIEGTSVKDLQQPEPTESAPSLTVSSSDRERLITQVFRPDVWFVPPPACNIIFPEEYSTFSFNRQMLREVTRLQLTTFNALYEDAVVNQYYFAPSFAEAESLTVGGIGSAAKAIIYQHEKFSGIVPRMERISEVSFYSKLSTGQVGALFQQLPSDYQGDAQVSGEGSADSEPTNVIENFAGRVAAYNFLSYRYAARTANVTGKFTPRFVVGFPMLVVNRPVSVGSGADPIHFLGMVTSVSHTVSQGGGNTSVSLTHARSHKTGNRTDDLFSEALQGSINLLATQTTITSSVVDVRDDMPEQDAVLASMAQNLLISDEIDAGDDKSVDKLDQINSKSVVDSLIAGGDGRLGLANPPSGMNGPKGGRVKEFQIAESDKLDEPVTVVGGGIGRQYTFTRVTVVEVLEDTFPLEEAIRPPWFSDEYANMAIGSSIYQKLFSCGSITDVRTAKRQDGSKIEVVGDYAKGKIISIEKSADLLVQEYSGHAEGHSAAAYIHGTTKRGFATLPQVMSSFHSEAYGPKSKLEGLDIVGRDLTVQGGSFETQQIVDKEAAKLDPRQARWDRVRLYIDELLSSRGLRG